MKAHEDILEKIKEEDRKKLDKQKQDLVLIEDFSRHYCIICKERIVVPCGVPVVSIGGCCVGVEDPEEKIRYVRSLKSHMGCYLEFVDSKVRQKRLDEIRLKLIWTLDEVKNAVEKTKEKTDRKIKE